MERCVYWVYRNAKARCAKEYQSKETCGRLCQHVEAIDVLIQEILVKILFEIGSIIYYVTFSKFAA